MKDDNIKVSGNSILLREGNSQVFPFEIEKYLEHHGLIFVLLYVPHKKIYNENVFAINLLGEIVWQIEPLYESTQNSPYTGIHISGTDNLLLNNWNGVTLTVIPETGEIIDRLLTK